jgi:hypothetical protein
LKDKSIYPSGGNNMKKTIARLTVIFLLLATTALAGTIELPRTGQTKCWDVEEGYFGVKSLQAVEKLSNCKALSISK